LFQMIYFGQDCRFQCKEKLLTMRFLHKRLTNHGTKIDFMGRPQLPFDIIFSFHNAE